MHGEARPRTIRVMTLPIRHGPLVRHVAREDLLPGDPRPEPGQRRTSHREELASDVAKQQWVGISDAKAAARLGTLLGVTFDAEPIGGLGGDDGALAKVDEDAWVALQIERKHNHPVENVLQYWRWLERSRRRLVLVHAIAPDARRRSGPRADLTEWAGAMMERVLPGRFAYCRVDLGSEAQAKQLLHAASAVEALYAPIETRSLLSGG